MFKIGDFSRIARVSARLLRFYDELGLLVPAHADPQTGYRYYCADQLSVLNRITVLKDLGFSLEQIGTVLKDQLSASDLRSMLLLRRGDAERALAAEALKLRQIETRIAQIEAEGRMTLEDVVVRPEPERRLLSLRRTVASFGEARSLIGILRDHVRALYPRGHSGQLVALAHSAEFDADRIDVEFGVTLSADERPSLPADSLLAIHELPSVQRMAVCVRVGLPEDAHLVTEKIARFVERNGDVLDGPNREVFLELPHPERMHEAVVEMQFPLAGR